jgi:hypothetical protein
MSSDPIRSGSHVTCCNEPRQRRIKRTQDAAQAAFKRVAHIEAPSCASNEIVCKTIENARVMPTSAYPTQRMQAKALPPSTNGIDALRTRFNVLREAIPEAVAHLRDEFQRADDRLHRELNGGRRELDLARGAGAMSA